MRPTNRRFRMRRGVKILTTIALGAVLASPAQSRQWQAPAEWHRLLKRAVPGTLVLDDDGLEFRSAKFSERWAYVDIHTFDLSTQELTLTSYQNRRWHE